MKNRILSYIFLVIIIFLAFDTGFLSEFNKLISNVSVELGAYYTRSEWEKNIDSNPQFNIPSLSITVGDLIANSDNELASKCSLDTVMAEISGSALKSIGNRGFYSDQDEFLYFTDSGYCVYRADYNAVEYELDQMQKFKQFLDNRGIKLLYVNEPSKYVDDFYFLNQFGKQSFLNDNMNRFLVGLDDADIKYLDLRESASNDGIDVMKMFYRTDHHWNVPAAKWAAEKIVTELNDDFSYNLDSSIYDDNKFVVTEFKKSWLGEQGRKLSKAYTGMEDYTAIKPSFDTRYTINNSDGSSYLASFDDFIMTDVYLSTASPYTSTSWHYSYEIPYGANIINDNVSEGKILVLGDSYEACLLPFLSLGVHSMDYACLRETGMTAEEIVEMGDYDVVIMAYAQFMVGAHDNKDNPNYNMFNLSRGDKL